MSASLMPMLAVAGEVFDSDEHLFEIKWDGIRGLAVVHAQGWQVWGRETANYTQRYPELEVLNRLPCGTTLDGELIVLRQGRPDLPAILARHGLTGPDKIRRAAALDPVTYVVFDLLAVGGRSICSHALADRRRRLAELLADHPDPLWALSEGLIGRGQQLFDMAVGQGHEGMMAKHLASRYLPGCRSRAWRKIKPVHVIPALIIGFQPAGNTFDGLYLAAPRNGALGYIAQVTCGFSERFKHEFGPLITRHVRSKPVVPCRAKAVWIEPEFYCRVRYLQCTDSGRLRGASFAGLLESTAQTLSSA